MVANAKNYLKVTIFIAGKESRPSSQRPEASSTSIAMSSLLTWPLKPTDFTLVSEDGEVLHCHKACLAENSEYFTAMLSHEFSETTNNQMQVPEYDGVTVASFLEWMYAPKYPEEVMKKLKESAQPNEFIFQKQFDVNKFSPGIFTSTFLKLPD